MNTEVIEKYNKWIETDNKSFEFNLESNGRLEYPMKFEIQNLKWGGYQLWNKSTDILIDLGNILIYKENMKNSSHCVQREDRFDYHGIEKALSGKIYSRFPFTLKRILVIQMK